MSSGLVTEDSEGNLGGYVRITVHETLAIVETTSDSPVPGRAHGTAPASHHFRSTLHVHHTGTSATPQRLGCGHGPHHHRTGQ